MWYILMVFFGVAQNRCWPLNVVHIFVTPSLTFSEVTRFVLGSGNHDDRGTKIGRVKESHHSIASCTSELMWFGYSSARTHQDFNIYHFIQRKISSRFEEKYRETSMFFSLRDQRVADQLADFNQIDGMQVLTDSQKLC